MEVSANFCNSNGSSVVEITESNIDAVIASNEIVFMFSYVDGYYTRMNPSSRLMVIFENAAKEITKARLGPGKVVMAKLNCKKEEAISKRFDIYIYYPIFILFRNGWRSETLYKGKHTVEAFVEFIKDQLIDPIIPFIHLNELHDLSEDKGHVIAYLESKELPEYDVLRKVATSLKENYRFYVKFSDTAAEIHRTGIPPITGQLTVVFRSTTGTPVELDETYRGSMLSLSDIYIWVKHNCAPLLTELTSENEERLRQGGPCIILIHEPCDTQTPKKYRELIRRELTSERRQFNFFIANGIKFRQCLARFDKSTEDLPLIIYNWYLKVNLFDLNVIEKPGKLNELNNLGFSEDLYYRGIPSSRLIDDTEEEYNIVNLFE